MSFLPPKNVTILIRGLQWDGGEDKSTPLMVTVGQMSERADGVLELEYAEGPMNCDFEVLTTMRVEDSRLTLFRKGAVNSKIVFEKGCRHLSYHNTMDGSVTVGITASSIACETTKSGRHIKVTYDVDVNHALTEENRVSIEIRETALPPISTTERGIYYGKYIN